MYPIETTRRGPVLAAALLVLLLAWPAAAARVASVSGDVEAGHGEPPVWRPLEAGDALAPGERVRTGDDGRAEIVLARATIRLYPNSLLRVPDAGEASDGVDLEQGRSLFDVLRGDDPFEVRTPEVVVSVKGTRFSVALAGAAASVAVFHGSVGVRTLALDVAREVIVREGFVASGSDQLELSVHDLADPWSSFSHDVLPSLPLPELDATHGARASLEAARSSAREAALPEAVARAAERHPEVRERVETLQRERAANTGDARSLAEGDAVAGAVPSRGRSGERGPRRDAVADAPASLASAIEQSFVEAWMNGGTSGGGGGGGGPGPFNVTFVSGSGMPGPDHVLVEANPGLSWQFEENFLDDVLDGSQSLPTPLQALLANQGITDPSLFAQQLLVLFD